MAECIVSSRRPCHPPQGTGPLRSSAFSPGPSTCQAPQDHTPVGCGPQSSHVFSAVMTQKSLRYKAMISANMLKIFSISHLMGDYSDIPCGAVGKVMWQDFRLINS
jgi:hypothetical protein